MSTRIECIFVAQGLESAERYDDMLDVLKDLAFTEEELSKTERELLCRAYRHVIGARRGSWRIISSMELKESNHALLAKCVQYRVKIEGEIRAICADLIGLLDDHFLKQTSTADSKVFWSKVRGDFLRYSAEITVGNERQGFSDEAQHTYQTAYEMAVSSLPATSPTRLGLVLNYATFAFEILGNAKMTCTLTKAAFDEAIAGLDELSEEDYKDTTILMQLMRDGTTLWTSDMDRDSVDEEERAYEHA